MPATNRALLIGVLALGGCERADPPSPPIAVAFSPAAPTESTPAPKVAMAQVRDAHDTTVPRRRHHGAPRWFLALSGEQQADVTTVCHLEAANPCGTALGTRDLDGHRLTAELYDAAIRDRLASLTDKERDSVDGFCTQITERRGCNTPLVVAFDAQPIEFTPARAERFAFRSGEPVASDWPSAQTPWLAMDRNGDGAIDSGAELFGDATVLPDGSTASNGFLALAALDANHDGQIDRRDPAFASLLLWADRNGDRASTPDELTPLASVVIAIPLAHHVDARCVDNDCEGERGTVVWRGPSGAEQTGAVVDVYLVTSAAR